MPRTLIERATGHVRAALQAGGVMAGLASAGLLTEIAAGAVASLVTLSNCLSYAALIYSGPLRDGLPLGLWAFMAGAAISCLVLAWGSGLAPAIAGPRNPPIAVASVLAAGIGAKVVAQGGSPASAATHVLVTLAMATFATGLAMMLVGRFRLGDGLRFVPAQVISGFLAAAGWFLVTGGLTVAVGRPLSLVDLVHGLTLPEAMRFVTAAGFVAIVHLIRRLRPSAMILPITFFVGAAVLFVLLMRLGVRAGWFLEHGVGAAVWSPLQPARLAELDWRLIASEGILIASVAAVAVIGLLLDVSALEAQRRRNADMDHEFRVNGTANMLLAPFGGAVAGLAPNASRLLDQLGARGRASGVAAGLLIGALALSRLDVTSLVPTPILGGLLMFLGVGVMADALWQAPGHRSRAELVLAIGIALAIVHFGYLTGIVVGLIGSAITFAVRYSRIGVIRRHATRAAIAAPVERAPEIAALLSRAGRRIHVFWLQGYIFFGSSNRLFEDIRAKVAGTDSYAGERRWVVLDLSAVSGVDGTAMLSFGKLVTWAEAEAVRIALTGMSPPLARRWSGFDGRDSLRTFATRSEALEWAELDLISEAGIEDGRDQQTVFEDWLARELGRDQSRRLLTGYLVRRDLGPGQTICVEGEVADSIDFVASGTIGITIGRVQGATVLVRRMTGSTVVGEMGFVRHGDRTASVHAETATRIYTLTRARYAAMRQSDPQLAAAMLEFFIRQLADRLEFANKEVAALSS